MTFHFLRKHVCNRTPLLLRILTRSSSSPLTMTANYLNHIIILNQDQQLKVLQSIHRTLKEQVNQLDAIRDCLERTSEILDARLSKRKKTPKEPKKDRFKQQEVVQDERYEEMVDSLRSCNATELVRGWGRRRTTIARKDNGKFRINNLPACNDSFADRLDVALVLQLPYPKIGLAKLNTLLHPLAMHTLPSFFCNK